MSDLATRLVHGSRRARRLVGMITVGSLVIFLAATPAHASGRVVPIYTHFFTPGATGPADIECAPRQGAQAVTALEGFSDKGVEPFDTIRGQAHYKVCFYTMADGTTQSSGTETFTGTIDRCGTGSVMWRSEGSFTAPDPATGIAQAKGTWSVVPGTGTGGFSKMRNGGGRWALESTPQLEANGVQLGAATC